MRCVYTAMVQFCSWSETDPQTYIYLWPWIGSYVLPSCLLAWCFSSRERPLLWEQTIRTIGLFLHRQWISPTALTRAFRAWWPVPALSRQGNGQPRQRRNRFHSHRIRGEDSAINSFYYTVQLIYTMPWHNAANYTNIHAYVVMSIYKTFEKHTWQILSVKLPDKTPVNIHKRRRTKWPSSENNSRSPGWIPLCSKIVQYERRLRKDQRRRELGGLALPLTQRMKWSKNPAKITELE